MKLFKKLCGQKEWAGNSITVSAKASRLIKDIFCREDAAHIRKKGKSLQLDLRHTSAKDPYRWRLLKEIIQSGEQLVIEISRNVRYASHTNKNGRITSKNVEEPIELAGNTFAAKRLVKQAYGELTGLTSQDQNVSYIFLRRRTAKANYMAHELLGHFYLDMRKVPSGHQDKITGQHGVPKPDGRVYVGRVHEFIQQYIEIDGEIDPYFGGLYE